MGESDPRRIDLSRLVVWRPQLAEEKFHMQRFALVCVLAIAGVLGCDSDDSTGGGGDAGPTVLDGSAMGGTGGAPAGGTGGTGGTGGMVGGEDAGADDGGTEPAVDGGGTGGTGGGTGGLAVNGTRLAVCYSDADCDNGLECSRYGNNAGFCVETCVDETDCEDIGGLTPSCSTGGVCRVDCSDDGTMGDCPANMECAEIVTGIPPLSTTTYRCQYPAGSGAKNVAAYGECDASHSDGDCEEGLFCQSETGTCVAICMDETDCTDPGTDAITVCDKPTLLSSEGPCGLSCSDSKDCPGDLVCQSTGLLGLGSVLTGKRCAAP
jgi:hypothetical protein